MFRSSPPYRLVPVTTALATAFAIGCGADSSQDTQRALTTEVAAISKHDREPIRTIDHWVPHVSTAVYTPDRRPTGEHVKLFMREKIGRDLRVDGEEGNNGEGSGNRADRKARLPAVLFLPSATQPAVPFYDLPFTDGRGENYNWMTYLAEAGFDVFAMELTGYGLSPRPHMDYSCNALPGQQTLLKNPCTEPIDLKRWYPYKLAIQSDWDEIDTVIDYIRALRGVDKVSLIGWSRGGPRVGGYAAQSQYAGKVEKLVLYSPAVYDRGCDKPPCPPSPPPPTLPESGTLMQLGTVAGFGANWARQLAVSRASPSCADPMPPESKTGERIGDVIESGILASDPVGSTWAKIPLNPPKNPLYPDDLTNPNGHRVWRAPVQNTLWGWNWEAVKKIRAPTLIIRGENDDQAPFEPQRVLFEDLGADQPVQEGESDQKGFRKVFVRVACAGHQLMFEKQHMRLLEASKEWLRDGSYAGHHSGSFCVDTTVKGKRRVTRDPLDAGNCSFKVSEEDVQAE